MFVLRVESEASRVVDDLASITSVEIPLDYSSSDLVQKVGWMATQLKEIATRMHQLSLEKQITNLTSQQLIDQQKQAQEKANGLEEKLNKFKTVLLRANKALEEKKTQVNQLQEQLQQHQAMTQGLRVDIEQHWCYLQPQTFPGGEAVAEFQIEKRLEIDGEMWCFVKVTESVDVQVPVESEKPKSDDSNKNQEKSSEADSTEDKEKEAEVEDVDAESRQHKDNPTGEAPQMRVERVTRVRYFWVPQQLYLSKLAITAEQAGLPETLDMVIEKRLKEKFDKSWNNSTKLYQKTVTELTERAKSAEDNLEQLKQEYSQYKTKAHSVLKQQAAELSKVQSSMQAMADVPQLEARIKELEQQIEQIAGLQETISQLRLQLEHAETETEQWKEKHSHSESLWKQKLRVAEEALTESRDAFEKEKETLQKEHTQQVESLKEEARSQRNKARAMLQNKDRQLVFLQGKLKTAGVNVSLPATSDRDDGSETPTLTIDPNHAVSNTTLLENLSSSLMPASPSPSNAASSSTSTSALSSGPASARGDGATASSLVSPSSDKEEKFDSRQLSLTLPLHLYPNSPTSDVVEIPNTPTSADGLAVSLTSTSVSSLLADSSVAKKSGKTNDSESEILQLATMQAQRDDELHRHRIHIRRLQQLLRDQEVSNAEQAAAQEELKSRIKELERASKRNGANLEYLKNVIVAWMEGENQDQLLNVIATILQFSPAEVQKVKDKRKTKGLFGLW
eukprot:TRINITY_DN10583_c0_g1_i1.p1 TRINITY_DN10583_c0_g1~~TRINITY_DN10583_c0_g1_i1.p1  ORF type:complete len:736 (-),score=237.59 TRINITY_DN10583_c0_g1_i1:51-2258(-)